MENATSHINLSMLQGLWRNHLDHTFRIDGHICQFIISKQTVTIVEFADYFELKEWRLMKTSKTFEWFKNGDVAYWARMAEDVSVLPGYHYEY